MFFSCCVKGSVKNINGWKKVYKSMYEWLNMWAEQYGSHEALCDNKGSYSYESLNTSVKNLSIGFADMGLRKSDKVILQLDNCNEFVIVCFALMSMGVIPILAVPGLRVNDLDIIAKKQTQLCISDRMNIWVLFMLKREENCR